MAGKLATKYAPPTVVSVPKLSIGTVEPLLVREAVSHMTPDQFAAYDSALRDIDYYALNPTEQQNYTVAIQAVNARRQQEGFNVMIRDGAAAPGIFPPGVPWIPLIAVGIVLLLARKL